jgi:hypothetical protein
LDEVVKTLIPQILYINVVEWEGHKSESLEKLRASLDVKFEYVDNELSLIGYYSKSWFFKWWFFLSLSFLGIFLLKNLVTKAMNCSDGILKCYEKIVENKMEHIEG